MRRGVFLCAGLWALVIAGCESATVEKVPDDETAVAPQEPVPGGERVTTGSIVGRWNVSLVVPPNGSGQLAEDVFNLNEELKSALKEVTGAGNVDNPNLFNWLKFEAEFRADGTCSLTADNLHEDGTWELDGDQLTEAFEGKPGKTEALAWEGPDKFTLMRTDGILLSFVREH